MTSRPGPRARETAWSEYLAQRWGGVSEVRLPDGSRCDIVTGSTCWEVEWPKKWPEAIGQSIWYSIAAGKLPGVCLLLRRKSTESLYVARCGAVCRETGIRFRTVVTR